MSALEKVPEIPKNVNAICHLAADDIAEYISTGDEQYLFMAFECVKLAVQLMKLEESR